MGSMDAKSGSKLAEGLWHGSHGYGLLGWHSQVTQPNYYEAARWPASGRAYVERICGYADAIAS